MAKRPARPTSDTGPGQRKPAAAKPAAQAKPAGGNPQDAGAGPAAAQPGGGAAAVRARVRMYRQGLGDCHLIRLYGADPQKPAYTIMIDCGVVLGTPAPESRMRPVVEDIVATTGGRIDLLIATHEHWDHLSGFLQVDRQVWAGLTVGEVWLAWTEDPGDELAQKLKAEKGKALAGLSLASSRMAAAGQENSLLGSLLDGFGMARGATTSDALAVVRSLSPRLSYRRPKDPPIPVPGLPGALLYVLGPPHCESALKRTQPSSSGHEGYGFAMAGFAEHVQPGLETPDEAPFDPLYVIPTAVARGMGFFQSHYWTDKERDEDWRRIDVAWLDGAEQLALQLDNMTNNTSLVLAIELPGGDVLLFAADAQVGNWLSWQGLTWTLDGRTVTGPDLLGRTILYKVGHHGSHNATLREKGLEMMPQLKTALVPVNHEMALRKRWGRMPLPEIISALKDKTGGRVYCSDMPDGTPVPPDVQAAEFYFEVTLP